MKITKTIPVEIEIEVDDDCDPSGALEDVAGAIRIALNQPVSIGAGVVELGEIVKSVSIA